MFTYYMKQNDDDLPVTQRDLRLSMKEFKSEIIKDMMKEVESLFSTFTQLIFERFDLQDAELAKKADKTDIARIENKLDATIDQVDDHEGRIDKLESQTV